MTTSKERAKNLILGALVADAAAMGLHWIYDQDHILKIAPDAPEFRAPDAKNYDGVPGYFAHAARAVGDQSQYGEQILVMLHALAARAGRYDAVEYAARFRAHFGYGGAYVGYIDRATRETLNNFLRAEEAALARARNIPFEGDPKVTLAMVTKAFALIPRYAGAELRAAFESAVRVTHDDAGVVAYGFQVLDEILLMDPVAGAVDVQLPAIAKLPALVASLTANGADLDGFAAVDSAVRTTNDHPVALAHGRVCARMMQAAIAGEGAEGIIAAARAEATPEVDALLAEAVARRDQGTSEVTRHFGMACDLDYGVPSVAHNVLTATSFAQAVQRNIYAGGDTCGRATLLGALCGAIYGVGGAHGIPEVWLDKLGCYGDVDVLIDAVLA